MSEEAHADHSKSYRNVLLALLVLTAITVGISRVHFGTRSANIAVGLLVAIVKASLVVAIFMHMKYEKRWWLGLVLFPALLVMIILFSNFGDTALNGGADPKDPKENGEFTTRADEVIPHKGEAAPHH
jgi:cytochrome c oxidase subunit 4